MHAIFKQSVLNGVDTVNPSNVPLYTESICSVALSIRLFTIYLHSQGIPCFQNDIKIANMNISNMIFTLVINTKS